MGALISFLTLQLLLCVNECNRRNCCVRTYHLKVPWKISSAGFSSEVGYGVPVRPVMLLMSVRCIDICILIKILGSKEEILWDSTFICLFCSRDFLGAVLLLC